MTTLRLSAATTDALNLHALERIAMKKYQRPSLWSSDMCLLRMALLTEVHVGDV